LKIGKLVTYRQHRARQRPPQPVCGLRRRPDGSAQSRV